MIGLTGSAALALASLGHAQISFQPATNVPTGSRPDTVAIGDFDGDGDRDLAVTTGSTGGAGRLEIYLNSGAGTFAAGQTINLGADSEPAGVVARDFTGDGTMDLVVCLSDEDRVRMYVGAGNGTFSQGSSATTGNDPVNIAAGDFDGDGDQDVVTSNEDSNTISIVLNNGGTFGTANTVAAPGEPSEIAAGDFNDDGWADIAVAAELTRTVLVYTSTGGGAVSGPVSLSVGNRDPEGVTTGDLNGDGDVDIAVATDASDPSLATVFLNQGGGTFGGSTTYFLGGLEPSSIAAADFDIDGNLDLVTANLSSGNVSTIRNNGNGTFAGNASWGAGASTVHVATADLDGNGSADIVAVNRIGNSMSVLLNTRADGGPTNYCIAAPNSVGSGAVISASGSTSIAANNFTIEVDSLPTTVPGLLFYGQNQLQVPFGDGFRCAGGIVQRLFPFAQSDMLGRVQRTLDFTTAPVGIGPKAITPGSTWNFQLWYRDVDAMGAGFNLTDGLSASFQP